MAQSKYKRVLVKLSGEALAGESGHGIDFKVLGDIVRQIKEVYDLGVQVAILVGAGNFWRGRQGANIDRVSADQMGMMATVINTIAIKDALKNVGIKATIQSAIDIVGVAEFCNSGLAIERMEKGEVIVFACGTGSPFFTTDTGAALRAVEIKADVLLLAKNVDGIYDSDPKTNPNAKKYEELAYMDFIKNDLKAMDVTAVSLCKENELPVIAFGLFEGNALCRAVKGEKIGTIIK